MARARLEDGRIVLGEVYAKVIGLGYDLPQAGNGELEYPVEVGRAVSASRDRVYYLLVRRAL